MFICLLLLPHVMQQYLLAAAHHSILLLCFSFLVHKRSTFFWLGFERFTVLSFFHQTVKNWVHTARPHEPPLFPAGLCWLLPVPYPPPSIVAPSFAGLPAFSLPSVVNFSCATVVASLSWSDALLTCSTSTSVPFSMNSVQFFPNQDPQVGVLRCCSFLSCQHGPQQDRELP